MTQTILIVDDDEMTRRILRLFFTRHEYEVVEADNGLDALKIIEGACPSLIIIDILMPGMDGISTVHKIRSKRDCTQLPVLFLTSQADTKAKNEAMKVGGQKFLNKPVNLDELVKITGELINATQLG